MLYLGRLIAWLTFPGVIVHEMAHQLFCRWLKVPVFKVCYFQFENPPGYVIHESPKEAYKNLLIGIGPFFINTVLGGLIAAGGAIPQLKFHNSNILDFFLIWLGISIAMHAFPSTGDASTIWESLKKPNTPLWLKVIGAPIVLAIYIGSFLSIFWLDLIYGAAVAVIVPNLLISLLA